jgi:hypothetical protein
MARSVRKYSKSPRTKLTTSSRSSTKVRRSPRSSQRSKALSSQQTKSTKSVSKRMSPRSAKAKGRKLQNWVVEKLLDIFKGLTNLDVRSTPMGVNGVDVQLSTAAYKKFPYDIECKNTERMTTLYNYYEQAISHDTGGEPLLVIKMNHKKPLAVVDAEHFIKVVSCHKK